MSHFNPKVDAYIRHSAPFAQPILQHIRTLVHQACPAIEEKIKWGMPHFDYKGMLCSMAAFKAHCSFTFWKGSLLKDPKGLLDKGREQAMGQFGKLTSLDDLPSDKDILAFIRGAVKLNDEGIKLPSRPKPKKEDTAIPDILQKALKKNTRAAQTFEGFSPSHKREYIEWITEAKTEATRDKRLATTLEWLEEGKPRNWKYMKK